MSTEENPFSAQAAYDLDAAVLPLILNALDPALDDSQAALAWAEAVELGAEDAAFAAAIIGRTVLHMTGEAGRDALRFVRTRLLDLTHAQRSDPQAMMDYYMEASARAAAEGNDD